MAEVYRALSRSLEGVERTVAIKRILPQLAEDEEFVTMFVDEAKIAVQLSHANIAQVYELGKVDESYYIAMEYVHGKDLRSMLNSLRKRKLHLPIPIVALIASRVCEGLDYAHRKRDAAHRSLGIVHRDVSPQNVLVSWEGEVKIIDFGIAKASIKETKTQAGVLKGKFGYMAPEQVRGMEVDRRADVFSVGILLYEMLTGERLFAGSNDFSTLEKVRNVEIAPPSIYNRKITRELEEVVMEALAERPEDRPQYASELHDELQRFLVTPTELYTQSKLGSYMRESFPADFLKESRKLEEILADSSLDEFSFQLPEEEPSPDDGRANTPPRFSLDMVSSEEMVEDTGHRAGPGHALVEAVSSVDEAAVVSTAPPEEEDGGFRALFQEPPVVSSPQEEHVKPSVAPVEEEEPPVLEDDVAGEPLLAFRDADEEGDGEYAGDGWDEDEDEYDEGDEWEDEWEDDDPRIGSQRGRGRFSGILLATIVVGLGVLAIVVFLLSRSPSVPALDSSLGSDLPSIPDGSTPSLHPPSPRHSHLKPARSPSGKTEPKGTRGSRDVGARKVRRKKRKASKKRKRGKSRSRRRASKTSKAAGRRGRRARKRPAGKRTARKRKAEGAPRISVRVRRSRKVARKRKAPAPPAKIPGFLTARGKPLARIFVDGKDTGRYLIHRYPLSPGRHRIKFVTDDRSCVWTVKIAIIPGRLKLLKSSCPKARSK